MANTIGPRPPPSVSSVSSTPATSTARSASTAQAPQDSFTPASNSTFVKFGKSPDDIKNMSDDDYGKISNDDIKHMDQKQIDAYTSRLEMPEAADRSPEQQATCKALALRMGQLALIRNALSHAGKG